MRKQIDQEYISLRTFAGCWYANLTLYLDYDDPAACKCFNVPAYSSHFQIMLEYEDMELTNIVVTYFNGIDQIHRVRKSFPYSKKELQFLKEMPIAYGFDENSEYLPCMV